MSDPAALFSMGFAILNAILLALNLKLYTEIMKERSQRDRHDSSEGRKDA